MSSCHEFVLLVFYKRRAKTWFWWAGLQLPCLLVSISTAWTSRCLLANTPDVNRFTFGVDRDALLSSLLVELISNSDISSRSVGETMKTFVCLAVVLLLGLTDLSAAKNCK